MICDVCGYVDEHYNENSLEFHDSTPKHVANKILANYKKNKRSFSKNRDGVLVYCDAESLPLAGAGITKVEKNDHHKIWIYAKPFQRVRFSFTITNDMRNEDLVVVGIQLAHPQPQFVMSNHKYIFGLSPQILEKKSSCKKDVYVTFEASDIGHYEMPIMFTFLKINERKNLIIIREMVVVIQEHEVVNVKVKSPFTNKDWESADEIFYAKTRVPRQNMFKIPRLLKILFPRGLEEKALEGLKVSDELLDQLKVALLETRTLFDEGLNLSNYMTYFHHLLWWEEIIMKINLRKYNMAEVTLKESGDDFILEVPGLAEKRPSLLRGDSVYIRPHDNLRVVFQSIIRDIGDNIIYLHDFDSLLHSYCNSEAKFDIHFMMTRVPLERMHAAISRVFTSKQDCRLFPTYVQRKRKVKQLTKFFNPVIKSNNEQRSAVEHILSGTSGTSPYLVYGPPGTGKTMTIVEAIVQIVIARETNRVLVCTDSNMAADHIALMLVQYNRKLNINNFIIRISSRTREWSVLPPELRSVSNGTNYENCRNIDNATIGTYRIVVTTLSHSAKYSSERNQALYRLQMTHLFIDEAAQASEPATLVPITGLLAPKGSLVLAGDPQQLGPVCISKEAKVRGLGTSLMERLKTSYENMYDSDPNYITMLVRNYRSNPDILAIPNDLFYDNQLQALAPLDPLSKVSILNTQGGDRAIVFHSVNSKEQKMGKAPSYFNEIELDMLKRYTTALIVTHKVFPKDIGIIAPYIRQVYKMKNWLMSQNYQDIEIGTVEAFQGKEKRVILVSTVRANSSLLDYDAKYGLGFLVDDKRFNVALTRAKAKLIIIGNSACLTRDCKWRKYLNLCIEYNCYFGKETEQIERSESILTQVTGLLFNRCGLTDALDKKSNKQ